MRRQKKQNNRKRRNKNKKNHSNAMHIKKNAITDQNSNRKSKLSMFKNKLIKFVEVKEQIGNTSGPHAIYNAYCAVGRSIDLDMNTSNTNGRWIEQQLSKNGSPDDIKVFDSFFLITKKFAHPFVFDGVLNFYSEKHRDVALIVSVAKENQKQFTEHWITFSIHHQDPRIRIYNSLANNNHKENRIIEIIEIILEAIDIEKKLVGNIKNKSISINNKIKSKIHEELQQPAILNRKQNKYTLQEEAYKNNDYIKFETIVEDENRPELQIRRIRIKDTEEVEQALSWLLEHVSEYQPLGMSLLHDLHSVRLITISQKNRSVAIDIPKDFDQNLVPKSLKNICSNNRMKNGPELWVATLDLYYKLGIWLGHIKLDPEPWKLVEKIQHYLSSESKTFSQSILCQQPLEVDIKNKDNHEAVENFLSRQTAMTLLSGWSGRSSTAWHADQKHASQKQVNQCAHIAQFYALVTKKKTPKSKMYASKQLPQEWMEFAGEWAHMLRKAGVEQQKKVIEVQYDRLYVGKKRICVQMKQYSSRIRKRSTVWVTLKNKEKVHCQVDKVAGKLAQLDLVTPVEKHQIKQIVLKRHTEDARIQRFCWMYMKNCVEKGIINMIPGSNSSSFISALCQIKESKLNFFDGTSLNLNVPKDDVQFETDTYEDEFDPRKFDNLFSLNSSQREAVTKALENRISVVQGPPGTGKTTTIGALVWRLLSADQAGIILCIAQTNCAARHMASSIAKKISGKYVGLKVSDEFFTGWHETDYTELIAGNYLIDKIMGFDKKRVWILTLGSLLSTKAIHPYVKKFVRYLIIDEASQIWNCDSAVLLSRCSKLERLILFGDPKQLPPYVAQEINNPLSMITSLMNNLHRVIEIIEEMTELPSRIVNIIASFSRDNGNVPVFTMLDTQYRMVKQLGDMISCCFYDGKLKSAHQGMERGIWWENIEGNEEKLGTSTFNNEEIEKVIEIWKDEVENKKCKDIAVICFYEGQRNMIERKGPDGIRVFNVDSFQGQEAEVIILSLTCLTASKFLLDPNRINVACSRAKKKLIIVGYRQITNQIRNKIDPRDYSASSVIGAWGRIGKYISKNVLRRPKQKKKIKENKDANKIDLVCQKLLATPPLSLNGLRDLIHTLKLGSLENVLKKCIKQHLRSIPDTNIPYKSLRASRFIALHQEVRQCICECAKDELATFSGIGSKKLKAFKRLNEEKLNTYFQAIINGDKNAIRDVFKHIRK